MKRLLVLFLIAIAGSSGYAQLPPAASQRVSEVRLAVLQSQPSPGRVVAAPPRQWTAAELAELRRQIQQQSHKNAGS
jgi:hypothetical protein